MSPISQLGGQLKVLEQRSGDSGEVLDAFCVHSIDEYCRNAGGFIRYFNGQTDVCIPATMGNIIVQCTVMERITPVPVKRAEEPAPERVRDASPEAINGPCHRW